MTTIDIDDLAQIIRQVDGNHDMGAGALAEAILDRLPAPQIIRTVEELQDLDPKAVVLLSTGLVTHAAGARVFVNVQAFLPAVVITPADQVRAARKALEKETNND